MSHFRKTMLTLSRCLGVGLVFCSATAGAMVEMGEAALADVVAQEGVSIKLELMINADAAGNPLTAVSPGSFIDCSDPSDPCRYALEFTGRADKWLVFKGYSGILRINDLFLDAQPQLGTVGSNPAYFNPFKFQGISGGCLLPGGLCTVGNLDVQPALRVSYPATVPGYDPVPQLSSGFSSMEMGIRLDGVAVEFGVGSAGYLGTSHSPFLGFNVSDTNAVAASIAIGGQAYVFGF